MPPKDAKKKTAKSATTKPKAPAAESQSAEKNDFLSGLYDDQIKKNNEEIDDLKKQLVKSAAEIDRLKKELTKQQRTTAGDPDEIANLKKELEKKTIEQNENTTQEKEHHLQRSLQKREEKEKELLREIAELKENISNISNEHSREIEKLKGSNSDLKNENSSLKANTQELTNQLELARNQSKPISEKVDRSKENSEVKNLLEQLENERKKTWKEIEKLKEDHKNELKRTEDEIGKLKKDHENQIKRLTTDTEKSGNQSTENSEVEKLKEQLENERKKTTVEIEKLKKDLDEEKKKLTTESEKLRKQSKDARQELEEEKRKIEHLQKENKELQEDIEKRKEQSKNNKQIKNLPSGDIASLRQENETLKNRLSQLAGAKLTEGNPNIADLSDKNRPTNLAEHFSELYDNEWTDALEEMTDTESKSEEEGIKILFDIVKDAYKFSSEQATNFYESVSKGMEGFGLETPNKWPHGLSKQVKDHRKSISVLVAGTLGQAFLKNQKKKYGKATAKYAESCAALCLYMCVQDPAVYIDSSMPKGKFDKDKYRAYTKSGDEYAFLVWPTLFLHKDGPMLGKGIAQGSK